MNIARNRLIHVYFDIDYALVAGTIAVDLRPLIAQVTVIVDAESDSV